MGLESDIQESRRDGSCCLWGDPLSTRRSTLCVRGGRGGWGTLASFPPRQLSRSRAPHGSELSYEGQEPAARPPGLDAHSARSACPRLSSHGHSRLPLLPPCTKGLPELLQRLCKLPLTTGCL